MVERSAIPGLRENSFGVRPSCHVQLRLEAPWKSHCNSDLTAISRTDFPAKVPDTDSDKRHGTHSAIRVTLEESIGHRSDLR